ncbi:MAG: aminomethyl-transferring glycine dehydrogenase subunit GcvPB [bacterium]|nr:aminomethyl-transferring glycine dehydrogenase subunit GcvPB [bacterium]MDD5353938.1 aminomethyl-transferring glycine dehydrogenase subunit GcvPB [bacterium]MDD5756029.1 aminomethyl-transferring glycine dehydrogenase subunit GcvPB [bacterium]
MIFEYHSQPTSYVPAADPAAVNKHIPAEFLGAEEVTLPQTCEQDVIRHFTALSKLNYSVDNGFYPLGSCTMKYNPKVNETVADFDGLAGIHPYSPEECVQGALKIIYELESFLKEVSGFSGMTLQPAAGAHGEITGILLIKAYHQKNQPEQKRNVILVPDTAHGTNPATAALAGYQVRQVKSDNQGDIDLEDLQQNLGLDVAALMLTNPNTLGLFEKNILEISHLVHKNGALLYGDGANFNALLGLVKPAELGFDVMHFNLHKTFSTPHGGGGPGAGAVGTSKDLIPFLPVPQVIKKGKNYFWEYRQANSIGKVRSFYGNFLIAVRAYAYFLALGAEGIAKVGRQAVLNANYLMHKLAKFYPVPYHRTCMHEFVMTPHQAWSVSTLDIAKRIIDYGFHPPTIYFPLIVHEAMMIEPTETETKETMDTFIQALEQLAAEAVQNPELLKKAPLTSPVGRIDEARAGRQLILKYEKGRDTLLT